MAVSSGVGQHLAWISVNGQNFPVEDGSTTRAATRKSGNFTASIPLWYPQVESTLSALGDNTTTITVQTRGQQATLMTGEIDEIEFDYIGGMVRVSGRDASAKLHATKSAEKWINKKPHEIVTDLAGRVGLSVNVDQTAVYAGRYVEIDCAKLTDGLSYAAVIHKLCEFMGAHWYVDRQGTLNVKSTTNSNSPYVINWSRNAAGEIVSDCLALQIMRNVMAGKPLNVTVNSWNARKKMAFVGTQTVGGNGTTQNYVYHLPGLTKEQADQHAKSKASDHARHEIQVVAEIVGDTSIEISQPLQLNGTAFSQSLTIDTIEDNFGLRGHTMRISAKSAKAGRSVPFGAPPSAGGSSSVGGTSGSAGGSVSLT